MIASREQPRELGTHMIALVKNTASAEQLQRLVHWIEGQGLSAHVSHGSDVTIVGLVGDTTRIDPLLLESMDLIERVQRVSEPFKLASRSFHPNNTIVDCGFGVFIGDGSLQVIAGPNAVEDHGLLSIARAVRDAGATILCSAAYKPRTSPYAFHGIGEKGLNLLLEAGAELSMPVMSEVLDPRDVQPFVDKGVNILKVSSRNTQNVALLHELGKARIPVMIEHGVAGTIDELLLSAEHVLSEGNEAVMLCERGVRSFETRVRSSFDVNAIPVLQQLTHLPIIVNSCAACGYARYVSEVSYAATVAGADALIMEVHDNPSAALTGGPQALTPEQFFGVVEGVTVIRDALAVVERED